MADRVSRLLVTAGSEEKLALWMRASLTANWIEGRPAGEGRETWLVTLFVGNEPWFLARCADVGATVQRVVGAGDDETYELLCGREDEGWRPELAELGMVDEEMDGSQDG